MAWMRRPWPQRTKCVSSRLCVTAGRLIRRQSCMWFSNWRTEEKMEKRVMARRYWMFTSFLLLALSAAAQQPANTPAATQPEAAQSAPVQPPQSTPAAQAAPVTMDQVVDRFVQREHGLVKMLETRNPIVETYLQNLKLDPQLGPVPNDDRY